MRVPPVPSHLSGTDLITALNDRFRRLATDGAGSGVGAGNTGAPPQEVVFTVTGILAIQSAAAPLVSLPVDASPKGLVALVKVAPTGTDLQIQVNATAPNGGATSPIAKLTVPRLATSASFQGSLGKIPAEYILTLDILAVGSTYPGSDLTVMLRF